MKVIPTIYKGYKFRSRLEARWAVFFDNLDIDWEYEKEGYRLKSGWYLPDFWLPYPYRKYNEYPDSGEWIEIKGTHITEKEKHLALDLSVSTKHSTNVINGCPWNIQEYFKTHHSGFNELYNNYNTGDIGFYLHIYGLVGKFTDIDSSRFNQASNQAKQARF